MFHNHFSCSNNFMLFSVVRIEAPINQQTAINGHGNLSAMVNECGRREKWTAFDGICVKIWYCIMLYKNKPFCDAKDRQSTVYFPYN